MICLCNAFFNKAIQDSPEDSECVAEQTSLLRFNFRAAKE